MKKTLQLLKGAVGKGSTINLFKCVHLYGDRIQAQNGRITIDAPCTLMCDFTVDADRFIKAISACDGTPEIKITPAGKLSLKKGSFKVLLPLSEHDAFPIVAKGAEGASITPSAPLLPVFDKLLPMCAEEDNRVWLNGINVSGRYAYATDGAIMARAPIGFTPETAINIPADAIAELVRMGIEPVGIDITESAITFDLGDVWMRAQLLNVAWPDVCTRLDGLTHGEPVPEGMLENVNKLLPFCVDTLQTIRLSKDGISTAEGEHSASVSNVALPDGSYSGVVLRKALAVATHCDFASFPKAIVFKGDGIEGLFMGLRE